MRLPVQSDAIASSLYTNLPLIQRYNSPIPYTLHGPPIRCSSHTNHYQPTPVRRDRKLYPLSFYDNTSEKYITYNCERYSSAPASAYGRSGLGRREGVLAPIYFNMRRVLLLLRASGCMFYFGAKGDEKGAVALFFLQYKTFLPHLYSVCSREIVAVFLNLWTFTGRYT